MGSRARNVISEEDIKTILKGTRTHFTSGDYHQVFHFCCIHLNTFFHHFVIFQGLESIIATLQDLSDNYKPKSSKLSLGSIMLIVVGVFCAVIIVLFAIYWLCIKKDNNSTKGSFEFIGSWGRNRNKNKPKRVQTPALRPKIEHIYQPVHTTEKIDSGDTTLAMSAREQIS